MGRGFTVFALWMALFAVGYDRLVKVEALTAADSATVDDNTYQSAEGGDGLPPRPCCK